MLRYLMAIACAAMLAGCGHVFTLRYSAAELEKSMKPLFPLQSQHGPFSVRLTQPAIRFNTLANRVGVRFDVEVQGWGMKTGGSTLLESTVEYRRADRAFYMVKPTVEELKVKGLPTFAEDAVRKAINLVAGMALKEKPIYTLDPGNSKEALAITYLRGVRVAEDHLVVEVSLTQ